MAAEAKLCTVVGGDLVVERIDCTVTLVAQAQVMALLELQLLRRCARTERHVTLEAPIRPALLLCDIEVHGMLGKRLVLD